MDKRRWIGVVDSADWIEKCLAAGVPTVQLRIKDPEDPNLEAEIKTAIMLGEKYQGRVFINDYWQLAIKHNHPSAFPFAVLSVCKAANTDSSLLCN